MKKIVVTITSVLFAFMLTGCAMNKSLHIPAGEGDLSKVKAEVNSGTNVNSTDIAGQTALMYASEQGRVEVVKYLVENGADVNMKSTAYGCRGTALIYAASANRITVMSYLLKHGADINATTYNKETALFWATAKGYIKAVNLLLNNNADTKLKNKDGKTALDLAGDLNQKEIVLILTGK
jgi:ankyrin repeat protein